MVEIGEPIKADESQAKNDTRHFTFLPILKDVKWSKTLTSELSTSHEISKEKCESQGIQAQPKLRAFKQKQLK